LAGFSITSDLQIRVRTSEPALACRNIADG
jgi:hypothetical protein